jgi:predicted SAM-dependent methyltransferase
MLSTMRKKCSRGLILDIDCGEREVASNAIGLDVGRTKTVDIIADARLLSFRDEAFDVVYSSHVIEHFSHREVKDVVRGWARVLKGGLLR